MFTRYNSCMGTSGIKKTRILASNGGLCRYCNQLQAMVLDHVIPRSRGGSSAESNLAPACWPCNHDKDDMTLPEWESNRKAGGWTWPPVWDESNLPVPNAHPDQLIAPGLRRRLAIERARVTALRGTISLLRKQAREQAREISRLRKALHEAQISGERSQGCVIIENGTRCGKPWSSRKGESERGRWCIAHNRRFDRWGNPLGNGTKRSTLEYREANRQRALNQWAEGGSLRERGSWSRQRRND